MATDNIRPFWGYPQPVKGPKNEYKPERKTNPAMRGWTLIPAVHLLEQIRPLREKIWTNAGFASLRAMRHEIEDYEPLHDPTVVPMDHRILFPANGNGHAHANGDSSEVADSLPASTPSSHAVSLTGYYSASTYRNLYLSSELTPIDVAKAILPLIRRDIEPKGSHHLIFFDTKADLVLKAAEESTQRYRENRSLGPLDGVPCAVKDEYDMDGYKCTLGSVNDYTAPPSDEDGSIDTWCIKKLREAGVLIVGKTSMHEFGLDTPGNNPNYGTPRNPFNDEYYTGGSSSGTGAAVCAGLIPIGLGSDGGGSIRIPSSFCNIFGLKTTHSRVSFWPSANHSSTCAVLGPMAADMESLATVFEVMAAPHPTSPFAFPGVPRLPPAAKMLELTPDRPKLLGICRAWFEDCAPAVRELCQGVVDTMEAKFGYQVIDIEIPFLTEGQFAHALTVLTDAATLLPEYNNLTWANRILLALGRTTPSTDYLLAQKLRRCLGQHLSYLWKLHPGMLIVTPTTACAGWRIQNKGGELTTGISDGDKTLETMRYVWMGNFIGLPSITVPAGYASPDLTGKGERVAEKGTVGKIPIGFMATGEWASEKSLIEFGVEAERAGLEWRERPESWVDVVELARKEKAQGMSE
ncbi:Fatty acid amide hydrolase [Cytospora mali]|uniref:Fatty acid amide hydrolase n=1 Tax=Cytospora mali TaxID=578113 RepID=A0A194UPN4_CYTMA|nr:Fatty acid amide hydrolase [Valsa mali var. pyri (nom. inval.)]